MAMGAREPMNRANLTIKGVEGIQREVLAVEGRVVKGVMAVVVMGVTDEVIGGETGVMAELVMVLTVVRDVEVMGATDVATTITREVLQEIITVAGKETAVRSHGVGDTGMVGADRNTNQRQSDLFSAF